MNPFHSEFPIRFSDIDAAGIVYFPRLLHFCHCALEDFVTERSGVSYRRLVQSGVGFPITRVECRFFARVRYQDRLLVHLTAEDIRAHAFRLRYDLEALEEGAESARSTAVVRLVHAVTSLGETFRLESIPDPLREALASIRESSNEGKDH
ncbi:MAG: thioesterase family protein [Planctomycetota bacterium]